MAPQLPNPFIGDMHATERVLSSGDLAAILAAIERDLDLPAFIASPSQEYLNAVFEGQS